MTLQVNPVTGLDGVIAAETALSHVDGEKGELIIGGASVGDIAFAEDFEALAARLWVLADGSQRDAGDARRLIGMARVRAFERLSAVLPATDGLPMVDAFRAALAAMAPDDDLPDEILLTGAMGVVAAALVRSRNGERLIAPDPELGHAADILRMLRGMQAHESEVAGLNAYLVTVSDHGMNASTFAGRVVASTGASPFMAITAAYCALSGPLHGGAPEPVLNMLDAIGSADNIAPWIDAALSRGERLMGFGHRIYRVRDPRADVLKTAFERLEGAVRDMNLAAQVEAYARKALEAHKPDRKLDTNVEFYTAILLDALKIPRQAFTPIFAAARVVGWTAHALEQQYKGRLLRPASLYVGPMPAKR
ncbi:citrate synthase/methylcitrate synthase [Rhizobium sp. L1K21]|uniref:citrate synthase/methylcitrate synthase n=1 Tax=Rhizobium sp. L1K21 TaxID=2954933 RepID=UPI0020936C34|nr:citrate synthase/methylcitrate synthase [Rhizobium sp. L1K21]MCO6184769.1 citrate synthase/methylcitrate synthase [Rhizobium sp. L1K21]